MTASFDHPDNKRISVARWMVTATADDDGSANFAAAHLLAQVTWWCQPNESTGLSRAAHRHPGIDGYWLVRSDEEWAEELGISARTVQRARKRLLERGYVECRRFRERSGTAMHWRRIYPALPDQMSSSSPDMLASREPDTESGANKEERSTDSKSSNPKTLGGLAVAVPESKIEAGSDLDPAFTEFWSLYPSKKDKGGSRKAWRAAIKKASAADIIEGARRFAADPNLPPEAAFVPHPKTWLNGERWNDGPLPSRIRRTTGRGAGLMDVVETLAGTRP